MKRFNLFAIVVLVLTFLFASYGFSKGVELVNPRLSGTYLTEEFNTKYDSLMIKVTYTFQNDSLYIDAYGSGCGIACMSLDYKAPNRCDAREVIYDVDKPENISHIRIYHLEFIPCRWDKKCYAVYRDGTIVDIIKKIP